MADRTTTDIAALQVDIKRLRADIAKIAGTMPDGVANGIAEAGETVQASTEKVWSEAKRHAQSVGREIEQKPLASALAAFGAGILLGVFLNGRRA
jgi:hypothetical protein